jgi:hypothetical protein
MTIFVGFVIGAIALLFGGVVTVALSGYGICGTELTVGSSVLSVCAAVVVSLIGFLAIPAMRWLGAALFAIPVGLGLPIATAGGDWRRSCIMLFCIGAAAITVWALGKGLRHNNSRSQ